MDGLINKDDIKNMIIEVRGKKVILDRDISLLFNMETRILNQIVKRNKNIFSDENYFQLNEDEFFDWKSQSVISNNDKMGLRRAPFVFTYFGIEILASILKSEKLRIVSKEILEAFKENETYEIIKKSPKIQAETIKNMIYELNGNNIMFDYDLANLYNCKNGAKTINQAVKRNLERFPNDFYFKLTEEDYNLLRSQLGTANLNKSRTLPYVFTEQGVYMLASILRTENAIKVNIALIRAFVLMRHFLENNKNLVLDINNINNRLDNYELRLLNYDNSIQNQNKKIDELFNSFKNKDKKELIFMNGEVYDSYSKILDIMNIAKNELIIIDSYADKHVLDMIAKLTIKTTLITKPYCQLKKLDIEKYNKQYSNLNIVYSHDFHDRFIIIDNTKIYHLGASINYAGNKVFAINNLEEQEIKEALINKVKFIL